MEGRSSVKPVPSRRKTYNRQPITDNPLLEDKMTSFLSKIQKKHGNTGYGGDQFGGSSGADGSGFPGTQPGNFMFATGIECSYPTIKGGIRRDMLEECGHYQHWQTDLGLVKEMGLKFLRYGLPFHKVYLGPGKFDWEFSDLVMAEMRRLEIIPILDLVHFGVPDWIGDFQNPDFPVLLEDYAEAVSRRYGWVRFYTPVNEMFVTARGSTKDGAWNERIKTDKAFVTAIKNIVSANILACQGLARVRNDLVIIQSESAEYVHDLSASPRAEVTLQNKLNFLPLDLNYGHQPDADVLLYLMDNGLTRKEYDWFMAGEPPGHQIMGNDYYGRNERILKPDGSQCTAEDVLGWFDLTRNFYERYHKPVFHTETNTFDPEQAPSWLWKQWANVLRMRKDGTPVLGFTWYSLIDQIDWDIQLAEKKGTVNACGLYDLERKIRPVGQSYKMLLENFGRMTMVPHGEMFELTGQPAVLKVEV